jgi:hypothetical protein
LKARGLGRDALSESSSRNLCAIRASYRHSKGLEAGLGLLWSLLPKKRRWKFCGLSIALRARWKSCVALSGEYPPPRRHRVPLRASRGALMNDAGTKKSQRHIEPFSFNSLFHRRRRDEAAGTADAITPRSAAQQPEGLLLRRSDDVEHRTALLRRRDPSRDRKDGF